MTTVHTDLSFLNPMQKWPPAADQARLARYATNRLLLEGDHDLVFTGLNEDDAPRIVKMRVNWFKRISTLFADLAVGAPPAIRADENQQPNLDRIVEDNSLSLTVYDLFTDLIAFGDGVLKVRWNGERGVISRIDPRLWFPVVDPDDVGTYTHHVLAWEVKKGDEKYVKVEIHWPGTVEHRLLKLNTAGDEILETAPLPTIDRYATLKEEEETGVPDFLVVPFSNLKSGDGVHGMDDFRGISDLVEEIERRLIKISGTLDVFADPWMAGPPGLRVKDPTTGEVVWASDEKYISITEGEKVPEVITWDANMAATFSHIEAVLGQLYVMAELSPAAFGETKSGLAESGSALKRLLLPTLAKVGRLRLRVKPGLLEVLRTTAELEVASRMSGAESLTNLTVEWRENLPVDPLEAAKVEATRRGAMATSIWGSLSRLDPDATEEDLDDEEARIKAEMVGTVEPLL
ncbi:phage portal protein [Candidatus Methanocrinis natronophilus]|uniref:Phage portal protein n=1 Tax=Candidatus Methanocrinis natronophilus TaxID=3033396 RepID=A0ABT5XAC6_9EURY|nr:phage portal protein [Candidatus Methanocrinis natronophilus]MDF0591660.1 phage portal protein [Candidatus Methanocrinis natronophilus]